MKKKRCYSSNLVLSALKIIPIFLVFSLISVPCVFASGSISGKVTIQGRSDHSSPILFKLKKPGETTPIATYQVTTDNLGSYVIADIPAGTYNLSAKSPNCLSQNLVLIEVVDGQSTFDINFSLLGGDANNDNSVATADMSMLNKAWLTSEGQPKYDPRVDFNGDKSIGTADMSIMRNNWLKNGTEPRITVTSPKDNSFTNTSSITVSGTIDVKNSTVTVNGIDAIVTNNAFTAANIPITEGPNTLSVVATNSIGNQNAILISIKLDLTPPSVSISVPDKDSTTRSNIVYGRVSEDTRSVTVNGVPATIINSPEGAASRFISRPSLSQGQNTITAIATDRAGNTGQVSITLIYNTVTPEVIITSPSDNSTISTSPVKVEGTNTAGQQFITVSNSTARVEGTSFTAEEVMLEPNKTVITATGYDTNSNKFSDSIVINSKDLVNYELFDISGDVVEGEPGCPIAGANQILKVKLEKNSLPAADEEIKFNITGGAGTLSSSSAYTDIKGEATITLTTDINSELTNQVECYPVANSLVKANFSIDTKPGSPALVTKLINTSLTPVAGAAMDLVVKMTDQYNNAIPDEAVNFRIVFGGGSFSVPSSNTNYFGEARTIFTCPNIASTVVLIMASSNTNPSVSTTFSLMTAPPSTVTVDELLNKVDSNGRKIIDQIIEMTVTETKAGVTSVTRNKIWEKGKLLKVQDLDIGRVYLPPVITPVEGSEEQGNIGIIFHDTSSDIYVIKSKPESQIDEFPYILTTIDYGKGVITKLEFYSKTLDEECIHITEFSDFIMIPQAQNAWAYRKKTEKGYMGSKEIYSIISEVTSQQFNVGLTDRDFH